MESAEPGGDSLREKRRTRRRRVLLGLACVLLLLLCVAVAVVTVSVLQRGKRLKEVFMGRCQSFGGYDCQELWAAFQEAYVGRDPCNVTWDAYDPLMAAVDLKPTCNSMMLWSKTKEAVSDFAKQQECFVTLEDTVLGSVLDGLTWCGKEGSSETLTSGCPGWTECENNPVRSFWRKASSTFAGAACGNVSAMLNGSITTPFDPKSIFGSIEVQKLQSPEVKLLTVLLVSQANGVSNCGNMSLKELQKVLDTGIKYSCKEVTESQLQTCSSVPQRPCAPCW